MITTCNYFLRTVNGRQPKAIYQVGKLFQKGISIKRNIHMVMTISCFIGCLLTFYVVCFYVHSLIRSSSVCRMHPWFMCNWISVARESGAVPQYAFKIPVVEVISWILVSNYVLNQPHPNINISYFFWFFIDSTPEAISSMYP
jgi:hypothetical protein